MTEPVATAGGAGASGSHNLGVGGLVVRGWKVGAEGRRLASARASAVEVRFVVEEEEMGGGRAVLG